MRYKEELTGVFSVQKARASFIKSILGNKYKKAFLCGNIAFYLLMSTHGIVLAELEEFNDNTRYSNGGAIANDGPRVFDDVNFINNQVPYNSGGALYNTGSGTITISGTGIFRDNQDAYDGGAIWNVGTININGTGIFEQNKGTSEYASGGALNNAGTFRGAKVSFKDNIAQWGGAFVNNNGTVEMKDATFTKNSASSGGAFLNKGGAGTINIAKAEFTGNKATSGSGGAIINEWNSGTITLGEATFTENTATSSGGAINNDSKMVIKEAAFTKNSAGGNGGAISNSQELILGKGTFEENKADGRIGGAIYNTGKITYDPSQGHAGLLEFTKNSVIGYSFGGAINNSSTGEIIYNALKFTENSSGHMGGAVFNQGTITYNATQQDSIVSFVKNVAEHGGGLYNEGTFVYKIAGFEGNTADYGGALVNQGTMEFEGALFIKNTANDGGGALLNKGAASSSIKKQGEGTWKLGGDNVFYAEGTGKTVFEVNEGALYLYRSGEVYNSNSLNENAMVDNAHIKLEGAGSSFILGADAVLGLGIGDEAHVISAENIAFDFGSKIQLNYETSFLTSYEGYYHDVLILDAASLDNQTEILNDTGEIAIGAYNREVVAIWDEERSILRFKETGNNEYDPNRGGSHIIRVPESIALNNPTTDIILNRQKAVFTNKRGIYGDNKELNRNFWGTSFYKFSQMNPQGVHAGYNVKTPGFALGYDDNISDKTFFGVAVTAAWPDYHGGNASADGSDVRLTVYGGSQMNSGWQASYMIGYGKGDLDQKRSYRDYHYKADYDYDTFNFGLGLAKDFKRSETSTIRPYVHYEFLRIKADGYQESGEGNFRLKVDDKTSDINRFRLGFDYIRESKKKANKYWRAGLFWLNQSGDITPKADAMFAIDSNSRFVSYSAPEDKNSLGVSIGAGVPIGKSSDLHFNYTGFYGSNSDSQEFSITFVRRF